MARRRWLAVALIAVGAIAASMFFVDTGATRLAGMLSAPVANFFQVYTHLGLYQVFLWPLGIVLLISALMGARKLAPMQERLLATIAVRVEFLFLAIALPGIFVWLVKRVIGRARPLTIEGNAFAYDPLNWTDAYASFPSGHTTAAFAVLVAFGALWPRLAPLLWLYAIGIAASRVAGSFHYVSDVIAGAGAGAAGALLAREYFAARGLAFARSADGRIERKPGPSRERIAKFLRIMFRR